MPRSIVTKARFERAYRRLSLTNQDLVDAALRSFGHYLETGRAPLGLGIKHLGGQTYEFRAGLALRIIYFVDNEEIVLALLGNHDEVRRFIKENK